MPLDWVRRRKLPRKVLHGVPNQYTYRRKLERKWRRRGYLVHFA